MVAMIGKKAPAFKADAVVNGSITESLSLENFLGKNVVLFFYPRDFTFVCPTELIAFQESTEEFKQRNTVIIGCSVDSTFCHLAWLNTDKSCGGISGVKYPLLSDVTHEISKEYHVFEETQGLAYRGLFLIDEEGIIRHYLVNDLPLGRSVPEVLRVIDAWMFFKQHGEVCPANWQKGQVGMSPDQNGLKEYCSSYLEVNKS